MLREARGWLLLIISIDIVYCSHNLYHCHHPHAHPILSIVIHSHLYARSSIHGLAVVDNEIR